MFDFCLKGRRNSGGSCRTIPVETMPRERPCGRTSTSRARRCQTATWARRRTITDREGGDGILWWDAHSGGYPNTRVPSLPKTKVQARGSHLTATGLRGGLYWSVSRDARTRDGLTRKQPINHHYLPR